MRKKWDRVLAKRWHPSKRLSPLGRAIAHGRFSEAAWHTWGCRWGCWRSVWWCLPIALHLHAVSMRWLLFAILSLIVALFVVFSHWIIKKAEVELHLVWKQWSREHGGENKAKSPWAFCPSVKYRIFFSSWRKTEVNNIWWGWKLQAQNSEGFVIVPPERPASCPEIVMFW